MFPQQIRTPAASDFLIFKTKEEESRVTHGHTQRAIACVTCKRTSDHEIVDVSKTTDASNNYLLIC